MLDGSNIFSNLKEIGMRIDYAQLSRHFAQCEDDYVLISYYTAIMSESSGFNHLHKFIDYLSYRGVRVVTKPAKTMSKDDGRGSITKGNMDVDMAVEAMKFLPFFDRFVFFTGDGDFVPLFSHLRQMGKQVIVAAVLAIRDGRNPGLNTVADEVRKNCDVFMNLNNTNDQSCAFLIPIPSRDSGEVYNSEA